LSKRNDRILEDFEAGSTSEIYFFRYEDRDDDWGLLAAALIWKEYAEADLTREEIDRYLAVLGIGRKNGFLMIQNPQLRELIQRHEASLVIRMAA